MKRRDVLRQAAWLGLASSWPLSGPALSSQAGFRPPQPRLFAFRLGRLDLLVVTDGRLVIPAVQPVFAPGVAAAQVLEVLEADFLPTDRVDFALNILLIKTDSRLILLDTGNGLLGGAESGHLPANLLAAGIAPGAVTDVLVTHCHSDHVGGLLTRDGQLAFPRATVHLGRIEYDFWTGAPPDFSRSKSRDPQLAAFQLQTATTVLAAVRHRLRLFDDGATLFGCVRVRLAPGHTPGHAGLTVFSEGQELVHLVDLVHHHALLFAHPEWGTEFDTDFSLAVETRTRWLAELARHRKWAFAYHLPWPGLGHVRRKGSGYEWVAQPYATPGTCY